MYSTRTSSAIAATKCRISRSPTGNCRARPESESRRPPPWPPQFAAQRFAVPGTENVRAGPRPVSATTSAAVGRCCWSRRKTSRSGIRRPGEPAPTTSNNGAGMNPADSSRGAGKPRDPSRDNLVHGFDGGGDFSGCARKSSTPPPAGVFRAKSDGATPSNRARQRTGSGIPIISNSVLTASALSARGIRACGTDVRRSEHEFRVRSGSGWRGRRGEAGFKHRHRNFGGRSVFTASKT